VALLLAHVVPSVFYVRHCTVVDSSDVVPHEREVHLTAELLVVDHLRLHTVDYTLAEVHDLLDELRPQIVEAELVQDPQLLLVQAGTDECEALTLPEEGRKQTTDSVLLLDIVGETLLRGQCLLQILL